MCRVTLAQTIPEFGTRLDPKLSSLPIRQRAPYGPADSPPCAPALTMSQRTIISTPHAPAAVGPYSQAVRVGQFVYTSGQIAIDPATGVMSNGDVQAQAELALSNLRAVLEAGGSSMANVIKTMVFLSDMDDFKAMNAVYARHFGDALPARSCVAAAALPLGAKFEIEAIGMVDDAS